LLPKKKTNQNKKTKTEEKTIAQSLLSTSVFKMINLKEITKRTRLFLKRRDHKEKKNERNTVYAL